MLKDSPVTSCTNLPPAASAPAAPADQVDIFELTPALLLQMVDRMYLETLDAVPVDHIAAVAAQGALPPPTSLH